MVLGARESVRELFQLSLKERSLLDEGSLLPPLRFSLPPERFLLALGLSAKIYLKAENSFKKTFSKREVISAIPFAEVALIDCWDIPG